MRRLFCLVVLVSQLALPAGLVFAGDRTADCTQEPQARWMSPAAISQKAVAAGYPDIRHVVIIGSCYEIEALTARRRRADVVMDPITGDVVAASMGSDPE
ncbi:hypothetical protein C8J36_103315 [Rhizobium sp. PP-F2F-G48]|uniref:PepSY domain-containing protein n=1 Tax=Rhizobium sp. PP-F2F-G48 TaxID=2135651 RepID=UPI0010E3C2D1|nr:PepSY domain-containing protein [Rhizobium sp. PP-F2F-G48]TCM55948.1 hypothetical protein C8J36_103315 [Rhizobium sp. PP-F2F-G48]